jgi:hypothetical protein
MRKRLSFNKLVAENKNKLLKDKTELERIYTKVEDKNSKKAS